VLALVAGLSAGQKVGLAVVAGVFIVFALSAAMLIPSRWPDFPTGAGLRPFLAATAALFVGMMLAVYFLARESESEAKEPPSAAGASTVAVSEVDFKIKLNTAGAKAGEYTFDVKNDGQGLDKATADLQPGESGDLTVDLKPGKYELYCSIDGHKKLGMDAELTVS